MPDFISVLDVHTGEIVDRDKMVKVCMAEATLGSVYTRC
jgi:hypothetical protein